MKRKIGVKAFIFRDGKLLIIKRSNYSNFLPFSWDLPGGRIEEGEDIKEGLKREVKEEVNLDVDILYPINVHHFIRNDKIIIHGITFLCKYKDGEVKLSREHIEYRWVSLEEAKNFLSERLKNDIKIIKEWFLDLIR